MGFEVFQVDAFTDVPFQGNPAAVCLLPGPWTERGMQALAREMNVSETAFVYRQMDGFSLRWFTPVKEVKLCGHATLASAHVLYETGLLHRNKPITFHTLSGELQAISVAEWLHIDLPAEPPESAAFPKCLTEALGIGTPVFTGKNRLDYMVALHSATEVRSLQPDFSLLAKAIPSSGVIVTSLSDVPEYDYICRYFDPGEGIDEDPVTGSAHCCLGPYWKKITSRDTLVAQQASRRGGVLHVTPGDNRVILSGQAVTVWKGELTI